MKKLIVISAPSGAGKTTLCHRLLRDFPVLISSVSCTTRDPRGDEKDGVHYHFITKGDFEEKIRNGRFAEWALVHGNYYGTSKDILEKAFACGLSVLLDIDVQGAASLRQAYPSNTVTIFISPPDLETLEARLRSRGTDTDAAIEKRLKNARNEMMEASSFDHLIVNDELERAYTELKQIVHRALGGK